MLKPPVKYLVLIESDGAMLAKQFDAQRRHVGDIDAASEEVAVMTAGLTPLHGAEGADWTRALIGHNPRERAAAEVYTLAV